MTSPRLVDKARVLALVAITVASLLTSISVASATSGPSWSGGGSGWSGTGPVFLPGDSNSGSGTNSAGCAGCSWDLIPICDLEGPKACSVLHDCPVGMPFVAILLRSPAVGAKFVGGQCLTGEPITSVDLGRMIAARVRQEAPKAQPGFQPRSSALTGLPTIFRVGQPTVIARTDQIAGISVDFRARARWRWNWGDSSSALSTTKPGGSWPDMSLTHTFRRPGTKKVRVRTVWDAEFTVNSAGPFEVGGGPIEQETALLVPVKEARAVLIGANLG